MAREAFVWDGIEHWTGVDLMTTVALISDRAEAESFMDAYTEVCDDREHAESNIIYICSLIDDGEDTLGLFDLLGRPVPGPRQWFTNSSVGVKS